MYKIKTECEPVKGVDEVIIQPAVIYGFWILFLLFFLIIMFFNYVKSKN